MHVHEMRDKFALMHPKDQLAMLMARIYGHGMTTTSGGNISVLDAEGDLWITPGGVDKGSLTRDDIVRVRVDGRIEGKHKPSSEFPFHKAVYAARPDLKAVLHAHPPALVAFSVAGRPPETGLLPNAKLVCGRVDFVPYALPGSQDLGERIAASFAAGFESVILENHGTVTAGADVFAAFMKFETLDFCARVQINAAGLGPYSTIGEADAALLVRRSNRLPEFDPDGHSSPEKELRWQLVELIRRSYRQQLFTSTEGTFSVRTAGNDFLITPSGYDRAYLAPEDLVLISGGRRERGKLPSRAVELHGLVYAARPEANAFIVAHPPHLMAFNVTGTPFDSRIIPEAYILLRDMAVLPFAAAIAEPASLAAALGPASPIAMVRNNGVYVLGGSVLQAFDRLEVAEYSAAALLSAARLGPPRRIGADRIEELVDAFKLPR
jgi:L-fuculose-phosphate aldolase